MESAWGIDHGDVSKAFGAKAITRAAENGRKAATRFAAGGKHGHVPLTPKRNAAWRKGYAESHVSAGDRLGQRFDSAGSADDFFSGARRGGR